MDGLIEMRIVSLGDLKGLLNPETIDEWEQNKGRTKTVEQLYNEIVEGDTKLFEDPTTHKLYRKTLVLFLVIKKRINGVTKFLIEYEQVFKKKGYAPRRRQILPAEKMKQSDENKEPLLDAVYRAVQEELGDDIRVLYIDYEHIVTTVRAEESLSYPGLETLYESYYVPIEVDGLSDQDFSTEEKDKINYWKWADWDEIKGPTDILIEPERFLQLQESI